MFLSGQYHITNLEDGALKRMMFASIPASALFVDTLHALLMLWGFPPSTLGFAFFCILFLHLSFFC